MARDFEIRVDRLMERHAAIRRARDDGLRKELAQAHKETADVVRGLRAAQFRTGRAGWLARSSRL